MTSSHIGTPRWTAHSLFDGDNDAAAAHRVADWASTPLGAVENWPVEHTAAVATVFASDVAMLLWLGPDLVQVFNDAYRPFLGVKYPTAVGQPAAECWPDVWAEMGPLADAASSGRTTNGTEMRLLMDRRGGLPEETYWTFSYSPIRGADGAVVGVFVATGEVTGNVLARRRMTAVQQLGALSVTHDAHPVATCRAAISTLASFDADFPLAMVYLDPVATFDIAREHRLGGVENMVTLGGGRVVELVAVGGSVTPDDAHRWLADGPGVKAVASVSENGVVEHLRGLSGDGNGRGPLVDDVALDDVVVLPLRIAGQSDPVGALVVGISPFQIVDESHRSFLDVISSRISTALTDVLAYEFQRQRGSALAELDATKTHVLENISHESNLVLAVLDTGIGLSASNASRVFERFYRVGDAHGRSAEGSGIGLALVFELATAMGGTVSVDSTEGKGSAFTVVVPVAPSALSTADGVLPDRSGEPTAVVGRTTSDTVTIHPGIPGGGSRTVLLVEDNADMQEYLTGLMTAQNWEVHAASSIDAALEHARSSRPGLVLTDVMLPGRSGLELVRELRGDPSLVRVPVVVLTARAGAESAVRGLEAGADDYVTEPFEPRELLARIRVHLELSAIREEILAASSNEASTLQDALTTRSTIGTAIGLLMAAYNCDADTAFGRLTRISQNSNRKARDVAAEIVADFTR